MSGVIRGTVSETKTLSGRTSALLARDGDSAYVVACRNGFEGTEAEWLESLKGDPGDKEAVLYTEQTLTLEQQAQARENIGLTTGTIIPATVE